MSVSGAQTGSGRRGEVGPSLAELIVIASLIGMLATLVGTTLLSFSRAGATLRSGGSVTSSPMEISK
jgi:hypothetical protein